MPLEVVVRFVKALRDTGRRRIPLDRLRREFAIACPELAEQADRRTRLSQVIQTAAESGDILLPRRAQSWDRTGGAPLPGFILLAVSQLPREPAVALQYSWHPLLHFIAGQRNRLRLEAAKRINEWLKQDPDLTFVVPIKERSLEIFGDEKRLDQLRAGSDRLFGALELAQLGCRICPIPLPFEAGPVLAAGRPILIIENNDTWSSFSAWNRESAYYSAVAYAGGGHAKGLAYDEAFIDELVARFKASKLFYFGDIDPAGVRIASRAAERRAARRVLPLEPETALYRWLLKHGPRTVLTKKEQLAENDVTWLPQDLRDEVQNLFAVGQRIPQEALGTQVLARGIIATAV